MRRRKWTIYKVGDIVSYIPPFSQITLGGGKGILLETVMDDEPFYDIAYHLYERRIGSYEGVPFIHCDGASRKEICNDCEYENLCRVLPDIIKCDISEFAEYTGKGKRNFDICKQRQCKYLGRCLTTRFIQK